MCPKVLSDLLLHMPWSPFSPRLKGRPLLFSGVTSAAQLSVPWYSVLWTLASLASLAAQICLFNLGVTDSYTVCWEFSSQYWTWKWTCDCSMASSTLFPFSQGWLPSVAWCLMSESCCFLCFTLFLHLFRQDGKFTVTPSFPEIAISHIPGS